MIIGISGKIGSGKDTVGEIIQILTNSPHFSDEAVLMFLGREHLSPKFKNKKFADKLKDIVCLLLNCTRKQLEDREFKEKELGEEWSNSYDDVYHTKLLAENYSPRTLLQLIGTNLFREQLQPNIWVNALFSEYKWDGKSVTDGWMPSYNNPDNSGGDIEALPIMPNWIITDMRFPNELKAVKDRGGISIRVNRIEIGKTYKIQDKNTKEIFEAKADIDYRSYDDITLRCKDNFIHRLPDYNILYENQHPSETALDDAEFDYVINNNSSLLDLVSKVRSIIKKENLI